MPDPHTELHYNNPYELLIAVILSAQCTDKRINMVTPPLCKAYPTPYDLAKASIEDVYQYIKSVTFPNNKSKSLIGMANKLVDCYNGEVPSDIDELVKIPGVGRKTANVILSVVYQKPAMAVDTHGNSGCNIVNGTLYIDPDKDWAIQFQSLVSTRKMCPNMSVETALLVALEETEYCKEINNDEISLMDGKGNQTVVLRRLELK